MSAHTQRATGLTNSEDLHFEKVADWFQRTTSARRKRVWLHPLALPLLEGSVAGLAAYWISESGWIAAAIVLTTLVFNLRLERRIQKQIDPDDEPRFTALAESLPGMVYQCRLYPTGKCVLTYANSAIEWIYEKRFEDMRDDCREILDLVHPEDKARIWGYLVESATHLTPWKGEYRVILPRQGLRWRHAQAHVERLPDGGTLWHGFISDVTWRKEAEESLRLSREREAAALREAKEAAENAERLKGEFLAVMSHEIRTPLNGVIGFVDLLKHTALDEGQREYIEIIEQSGERLLAMINETLDFSKLEAGNFSVENKPFPVREHVQQTFNLLRELAAQKGLRYVCSLSDEVPAWLSGDAMRIGQVLNNVLGNAIKYTDTGEIALSANFQRDADGSGKLTLAVRDTGRGISPEEVRKIFTPYYQIQSDQPNGTGLGLAISQKLCRLMGGDLTVESDPGRGSQFVAEMRCREALPPQTLQPSVPVVGV